MFRIIIPLIVGQIIMQRCPPPSETNEPIANSIREMMWPLLLIAMGFAWNLSSVKSAPVTIDLMYLVTLAAIAYWLKTQFCTEDQDRSKLLLLLIAVLVGGLVWMSAKYSVFASVMLSIMLIWLLFAEQLQLPKIRIHLPSVDIKMPKLTFNGNEKIVSVESQGGVNVEKF
jgi:chromate transport protein ChrA